MFSSTHVLVSDALRRLRLGDRRLRLGDRRLRLGDRRLRLGDRRLRLGDRRLRPGDRRLRLGDRRLRLGDRRLRLGDRRLRLGDRRFSCLLRSSSNIQRLMSLSCTSCLRGRKQPFMRRGGGLGELEAGIHLYFIIAAPNPHFRHSLPGSVSIVLSRQDRVCPAVNFVHGAHLLYVNKNMKPNAMSITPTNVFFAVTI